MVPRALAVRDTRGLIKLVADAKMDSLFGGLILAPEGDNSIQTVVLAIKRALTTKALGERIFPDLTVIKGLKLAAQGFGKDAAKLSCCAVLVLVATGGISFAGLANWLVGGGYVSLAAAPWPLLESTGGGTVCA